MMPWTVFATVGASGAGDDFEADDTLEAGDALESIVALEAVGLWPATLLRPAMRLRRWTLLRPKTPCSPALLEQVMPRHGPPAAHPPAFRTDQISCGVVPHSRFHFR
jgi:hypothetical protein